MNKLIPLAGIVAVIAFFLSSCLFVVDQRQFALVFALGEIKRVVDQPGLYFKLPQPLQNIIYLEKRTLTIDTPDADRFITKEKQNVVVDTYVKWRIEDAKTFYTSVAGRVASANDRISRALRDGLNNEIATRTVNDVISGEREKVMENVTRRVAEDATQIGVKIVDVRLRRVDFADEIRDSVFRRMESERKAIAAERRSEGAAEAEKIRANADRQRVGILAQAYKKAQDIKGTGDAVSAAAYSEAFGRDPEFAEFYRSLQAYRESFKNSSDLIVTDPDSDFFRFFQSNQGVK
ncbi:MAG: HflC protein [Betaproteobacteria bacterium TMED82]|nr:MAG: HflC protein [Betaproteobacteria bacterium TMED82]|tara:strand:+ start:100299 stop:101174 length:876 start_codon:yes stop_codon:yes gene_type:complete